MESGTIISLPVGDLYFLMFFKIYTNIYFFSKKQLIKTVKV